MRSLRMWYRTFVGVTMSKMAEGYGTAVSFHDEVFEFRVLLFCRLDSLLGTIHSANACDARWSSKVPTPHPTCNRLALTW